MDWARLAQQHLLVIGDVMLDRYWFGPTERISPEAPVPVVRVARQEDRAGGAANVAMNLAALGAQVTLIGIVGDDSEAGQLTRLLQEKGVQTHFYATRLAPTITKTRVMSRNQQLIRMDAEERHDAFASALLPLVKQQLDQVDGVIFSDYGKGALSQVQALIQLIQPLGRPMLIDPKGRDFARYQGASLLTPNLSELRAIVGPVAGDQQIEEAAQKLIEQLNLEALLVTRSEEGMSYIGADQTCLHRPAQAQEVYDVTGAGDTVIATLALALCAGLTKEMAIDLANTAAGIVVSKSGTATVTLDELRAAIG
ncbi:D-glycero-beta-D-manno-heptose-7-phosphate kinase [Marinospirillum sp. MEB164]|uniref:D-glycero-beta-D-manno-heptose-7-phosphate kinase n=1 Tax=Marinospirillum alkalitolerans TaxID=3123374 RepID=A0ABW8PYN4_9GAMM